jgi:hypothetical protein
MMIVVHRECQSAASELRGVPRGPPRHPASQWGGNSPRCGPDSETATCRRRYCLGFRPGASLDTAVVDAPIGTRSGGQFERLLLAFAVLAGRGRCSSTSAGTRQADPGCSSGGQVLLPSRNRPPGPRPDRGPGERFELIAMVEAVGIEPTSENPQPQASTSISGLSYGSLAPRSSIRQEGRGASLIYLALPLRPGSGPATRI